ncbi:MAG: glycosyltransferase family 2 protein [Hyphomonadaceae bacterium]
MDNAPNNVPASASLKQALPEAILVAIPTLNEEAHIETCIRSLLRGDDRLTDIKVVVADGGSSDRTVEIVNALSAEFPNLSVVDNPKRLQSAAINKVAANATDKIKHLIRCDAHSIYPPGFVTQVADAMVRTEAASVVVCMDAVGTSCFQKANAWIVDTPLGSGGSAHRGGTASGYYDHGHHAGFNLEYFRKIEGYDESFSHNEDAEYDHRLALAGGKIWLDADIRLSYLPRPSVRSLAKQYYAYGRGRARNLIKHKAKPKLRQLAPVVNLLGLVAAGIGAVVLPLFAAYPAVYLSALLAASVFMALKHKSACGLLAGLASGTMHIAWAAGFLRQFILR